MDPRTWLGALAEAKVASRLIELGWEVFRSTTGKAPFDLVAAREATLLRVEVKGASTLGRTDGCAVMLKSVRPNRSRNRIRYPSCDTSDVLAVYLQPHDEVCFLWTHEVAGRSTITLHAEAHPLGRRRNLISDYARLDDGAVAEWTKATALKVVDLQGSVGSNPTRSA